MNLGFYRKLSDLVIQFAMRRASLLTCASFLVVFLIVSCRKNIEQGAQLSISGIVYDSVKNKTLPNATIYLFGAYRTFYGIYYSDGPLDSATSDNAGRFSLHFTADGKHVDYGVSIGQLQYGGYSYGTENYVIDYTQPMYRFNYKNNIGNAVVRARELNYTKVHLRVVSNPFDSFYVRTYSFGLYYRVLVRGQSIDTTITLRQVPQQWNVFQFYTEALRDTAGLAALNSVPNSHTYSIRRMISDTMVTDMQDTITINKTINNSLDMPRQ